MEVVIKRRDRGFCPVFFTYKPCPEQFEIELFHNADFKVYEYIKGEQFIKASDEDLMQYFEDEGYIFSCIIVVDKYSFQDNKLKVITTYDSAFKDGYLAHRSNMYELERFIIFMHDTDMYTLSDFMEYINAWDYTKDESEYNITRSKKHIKDYFE
ncbi:hypothetical protein CONCODRAFT_73859 [Conidiobolus coronatus NRRL 28638]|uniref:Uncharacterized protein n=1 Tax=Conidiobolus coronatus (strain ATCC 28846 / CBS 209.66 / NRRL 28638) TaxID=796925 RepID=A0A137NU44_CONC2|nr:hypothetical protein CONCODRAFT_73859 [Conidiobolus coronatus NRRL 28638]|eukprot:KXN66144.1 hypothetical protein CONCODRAFT_73859 [Conidiobolus coronatus NRRL 28638]